MGGFMQHNKSRDGNEKDIVKIIRSYGVSVTLLDTPCDLLCGFGPVLKLAEVKMPANLRNDPKAFTPAQKKWRSLWNGPMPVTLVTEDQAHDFANNIVKLRNKQMQTNIEHATKTNGSNGASKHPNEPNHIACKGGQL